jgi:EAL domain-containing protein (putative c-di-GMP-specific phosphodiesterase class I)
MKPNEMDKIQSGNEKNLALVWLSLESDLKKAMEREELKLDYQPVIEVQSGRIYGMEALLEWVLKVACSQTVNWQKLTSLSLKIFINLSTTHIKTINFIEILYYVLNSTKIGPSSVVLEIPQTAKLEQEDAPLLKTISRSGVALSIDDFGTSNSSWQLLKYFDIIKIDNALIKMINHYQDDSAKIVSAIFAMAKGMGIKTLVSLKYQTLRLKSYQSCCRIITKNKLEPIHYRCLLQKSGKQLFFLLKPNYP